MISGGNPMVKARRTMWAFFVLLRERDNVTGLLYQAYVGPVESDVFDSPDISDSWYLGRVSEWTLGK